MRPWPPWLSRLSTSVLSSAAANRSKLQSSARARSASLGSARPAAGALSARNRCASSDAGRLMRSTGRSGPAIWSRPPAPLGRGGRRAGASGFWRARAAGWCGAARTTGRGGRPARRYPGRPPGPPGRRRGPRRAGRPVRGRGCSRRCRHADRDPAEPAAPTVDRCRAPRVGAAPSSRARRRAGRSGARAASCAPCRWRARRTSRPAAAGSRARWRTLGRVQAALEEVLQALDDALGLRVARLAKMPVDPQRPAERGELTGRPTGARVKPGLAVPDQRLGQRAQRPQTAPNPRQQLRRLLGEDQRPRAGTRIAEARDDDPPAARLPKADRDLRRRLPQIELADLPRPIDGALIGPRRREQRPDLAQIVIDDRLAPIEPQRRNQLPNALPRQPRVLA